MAALAAGAHTLPDALDASGTDLSPQDTVAPVRADQQVVVLPLMHGPFGEDGTVQGLLELADVAYIGSGVLGSAANMDKVMAKVVAGAAGLPLVRHLAVRDVEVDDALVARVGQELGWPVFVKPANMGSSVGVTRADGPDSLHEALAVATSFDEWAVVEEAVTAREIEVGVLGNESPRASIVGEIVPTHEFYDYEDKYLDGAAEMVIPADLPAEVAARPARSPWWRSRRCAATAWPGWTSSTRRAAGGCCSTRSTPCPASPRSRCSRRSGPPPASPTPSSSTSWWPWPSPATPTAPPTAASADGFLVQAGIQWVAMGDPNQRLDDLGIVLPDPFPSFGTYEMAVLDGDTLYTAGHLPVDGSSFVTGKLGADLTLEQGVAAAQLAALSMLSTIRAELGDLARVRRVVNVTVTINSTPDFRPWARASDLWSTRRRCRQARMPAVSSQDLDLEVQADAPIGGGGRQDRLRPATVARWVDAMSGPSAGSTRTAAAHRTAEAARRQVRAE